MRYSFLDSFCGGFQVTSSEKNNLEPVGFLALIEPPFRKKFLFFILGLMCILGFQYMCWKEKVIEMPPADYAKFAVDLEVTQKMRYGFCLAYHGAFLVKTANTEELNSVMADKKKGSAAREDKEEEQEEGYEDDGDSISEQKLPEGEEHAGVKRALLRELELVPIKTMMETALYSSAFFLVFWGPSLLTKLEIFLSGGPLRREFWAGAIPGITGFWLMDQPLLVLEYGPPLFSNWIGPGALSYSTGLHPVSSGCGMTISYRNVIEQIIFWPSVFYLPIGGIIPEWAQGYLFYAIFAPSYYGVMWGSFRAAWFDFRNRKRRQENLPFSKE